MINVQLGFKDITSWENFVAILKNKSEEESGKRAPECEAPHMEKEHLLFVSRHAPLAGNIPINRVSSTRKI